MLSIFACEKKAINIMIALDTFQNALRNSDLLCRSLRNLNLSTSLQNCSSVV